MSIFVNSIEQLEKAILRGEKDITLKSGQYNLEQPLVIKDISDLIIKAQQDVILSGASETFKKGSYPNSLFVNDKRRQKSKGYTVKATQWSRCQRDDFIFSDLIENRDDKAIHKGFVTTNTELENEIPENIEFVFDVGWTQSMANGKSFEKRGDLLFIELENVQFDALQAKRVCTIGAPTELRNIKNKIVPGDFYHDKKNDEIIYLPTLDEQKNGYEIMYPHLEQLIIVENCTNIKIENISFKYTTWEYPSRFGINEIQSTTFDDNDKDKVTKYNLPKAALSVENSENIVFDNCVFSHLGGAAIHIGRNCANNAVLNSTIEDIAAGGIIIGYFEESDAQPENRTFLNYNTLIQSNKINKIGVIHNGACAVLAGYVDSVKIYDNEISDIAYTGVSVGWGWGQFDTRAWLIFNTDIKNPYSIPTIMKDNHIKKNKIYNVMKNMHDGAGIYTLSAQPGSVIEDNYIHDNGDHYEEPGDKIYVKKSYLLGVTTKWGRLSKRKGFPGGIYLDEASSGFTIKNNKIENVACNYFYHDTGIPGIFESNKYDVEKLDNPILCYD